MKYNLNMVLLDYVKRLELKSNLDRGEVVIETLQNMGLQPNLQKLSFPRIQNISVDFSNNPISKKLFLSAHYDAVAGSPGANDDASGIAVLLGLCQYLTEKPAPVRVVFFDREEAWLRTPVLRLGLLGSLYYALKTNLHNIAAIYNLEMVGNGDFLGIWPVKERERNLLSVRRIEQAADEISITHLTAHISWLILSGDHLSFRFKGMADAISLSLLPRNLITEWQDRLYKPGVLKRLRGGRRKLPEPVCMIHSPRDSSANINESSLQLMLSILMRLINDYSMDEL